ncbi:MAG: gfo/Idh/MocA family oxidoreductase, partial [Planctomycetia bacterium]
RGTHGEADISGNRIEGKDGKWKYKGETPDPYQQEHDDLFASIRAGRRIDDGSILINSNLLALMARASAYSGQVITPEQVWAAQENLVPDPITLDMPPPATPIAEPGKTKFV